MLLQEIRSITRKRMFFKLEASGIPSATSFCRRYCPHVLSDNSKVPVFARLPLFLTESLLDSNQYITQVENCAMYWSSIFDISRRKAMFLLKIE